LQFGKVLEQGSIAERDEHEEVAIRRLFFIKPSADQQ
jgi:hypothetical protein